MNIEEVHNLITNGEGQTVEFKQSFSKTVIETFVPLLLSVEKEINQNFMEQCMFAIVLRIIKLCVYCSLRN